MISFLRTLRGMRVNQPDFEFASFKSARDNLAQIVDRLMVGDDLSGTQPPIRHWIIAGFSCSEASNVLTVTGGTAILGYRAEGEVKYGALVNDTESRTISLSGFDTGTFLVYVRASYRPATHAGRAFWNPLASPDPIEYVRNIATRFVASFDVAVQATSPGDEWTPICSIARTAPSTNTPTDVRNWFFEGRRAAATMYQIETQDWGTSQDRQVDRANVAAGGVVKFVRMVQRQLQDIIGGTSVYTNPQSGTAATGSGPRSLTQLNSEKLARTGGTDSPMIGDLIPDATGTRDLGSTGRRWAEGWINDLRSAGAIITGDAEVQNDLFVTATTETEFLTVNDTATINDISAVSLGVSTNATVTGQMTAAEVIGTTSVFGPYLRSGTALATGASPPSGGALYQNNTPACCARISIDGLGAITQHHTFNIDTITRSANVVRFTFDRAFTGTTYQAMVVIHSLDRAVLHRIDTRNASYIEISITDTASTPNVISLTSSISIFDISIALYGTLT